MAIEGISLISFNLYQTPWVMGSKGQTSAQGQCTAEIRTLYRLFPLGRRPPMGRRPEADSQLPVPACRPVGVSDKWLYIDPEYPETYTG